MNRYIYIYSHVWPQFTTLDVAAHIRPMLFCMNRHFQAKDISSHEEQGREYICSADLELRCHDLYT